MHDVFRPRMEPHCSIYDAFQDEAAKRKVRPFEEWSRAEMNAVHQAATTAASDPQFKLKPPTMEMVRAAEIYARGSADYGLKWTCQLIRSMQT